MNIYIYIYYKLPRTNPRYGGPRVAPSRRPRLWVRNIQIYMYIYMYTDIYVYICIYMYIYTYI